MGTQEAIDWYNQYLNGDIKKASVLIQKALKKGDYTVAAEYADICLNNLDGNGQSYEEAAFWYIKASMNGDGNILSWLRTISPGFISEKKSEEEKVKELTDFFYSRK